MSPSTNTDRAAATRPAAGDPRRRRPRRRGSHRRRPRPRRRRRRRTRTVGVVPKGSKRGQRRIKRGRPRRLLRRRRDRRRVLRRLFRRRLPPLGLGESLLTRLPERRRRRYHAQRHERGSLVARRRRRPRRRLWRCSPPRRNRPAADRGQSPVDRLERLAASSTGFGLVDLGVEDARDPPAPSRARSLVEFPDVSVVHPSQRVPVLIPVPPRLHHVGVHVEVARGLNLGVHRLSHRPLPGLDAALFLLREYLRGPHLLLSPSPRFFLPTGLWLFGLRLQAGDALHGGVTGPVLVPEEQLLDLRGVIALNLDAIVTGDGASRAHRSLHHRQKLGLIASDVSDDCRHLALRPLLDGDGHPALLCAAHLERHDDTRPPEPSSPPPPGAPRSASPTPN